MEFDHVQLAIPVGGEEKGRRFWSELLGASEIAKPHELVGRGGAWFRIGAVEIHLGCEEPFRPAAKAHPALRTDAMEDLAEVLEAAGHMVAWDRLPASPSDTGRADRRRFYVHDPFGNRLEFVEPPHTARS